MKISTLYFFRNVISIDCINTSSILKSNFLRRQHSSPPNRIQRMSVFTQSLNPITGTTCWEEKDADYDYHQEVARSAFADMLHDHERNEKYFVALKAAIDKKHSLGQKANVLDIGTGTGLLSMMAAKCGADSITACEAFRPMAKCAIKILEDNGCVDKIKLILKRSTEIVVGEDGDMPHRANILVTEVFDTELIGEGALSTFQHAHKVLLEEDSIVVPHSGTVWAQVVDSPTVRAWNRIEPILNSSGDKILVDTPSRAKSCSGAAAVHDLQLSQLPFRSFTPLIEPQAVCRFDWSGKTPFQFTESFNHKVTPIANGTAHAVFMWWDLNMDTEGKVLLSCAPVWEHPDVKEDVKIGRNVEELSEKIPWRDHWMQAVYYFSKDVEVSAGKEVTLVTSHDEYSFWYHLSDESSVNEASIQRPICDCFLHLAYSRTRIGQLNDKERSNNYIKALEKNITPDSICLCLSDGCLLGLAAAKLGAKKVIILESNGLSRRAMEMYVEANKLSEKVQIVSSRDELNPDDKVNLIFGEPNFVTSIVPWDNVHFWHLSSKYPESIARIPKALTVKGVAVEFKDLHKIRAPLGICEGFDLSTFDKLVQFSRNNSQTVDPTTKIVINKLVADKILYKIDVGLIFVRCITSEITPSEEMKKSARCVGFRSFFGWSYLRSYTSHEDQSKINFVENFVGYKFDNNYFLRRDNRLRVSSDISDNPIEAHPLWEYPGRALSSPFTILKFNFEKNISEQSSVKLSDRVSISNSGSCNGIALWVDWTLDSSTEVSSGPTQDIQPGLKISWDPYTRQGVYLPRNISTVSNKDSLLWSVDFSPLSGDVKFEFKIV